MSYSELNTIQFVKLIYIDVLFQVFMKSVKLEWCLGEIQNARKLLEDATGHYPDFAKVIFFDIPSNFASSNT